MHVYGRRDDLTVYVIQEVLNEGTTWVEIMGFDSTWTILDPDGGLTETGPFTFAFPMNLAPGEMGYVAEQIYVPEHPREAFASLETDVYYDGTTEPDVTFSASEVRIREGDFGGWEVIGRVTNDSSERVGQAQIGIVLTDAAGIPVAIDSTYVENLEPGQPKAFQTLGSNAPIDINSVDVRVFVNDWDF